MIKDFKKRDIAYLWLLVIAFLVIVFVISNTMYLYGSQLDWNAEHASVPDYFRTLFYSTKDLFPDFAANIGSGQNIYNLSYYGFLSPIIMVSYLMPKVSMSTFIIVSTILCVIISAILLYLFLRKKNYSSEVSFVATFIYIMSSSVTLHSHRHIMFINYMPFLILGLYGVDKKLEQNKGWLLSLSVFLMIMTSYYFSIGGIVTLVIYGIFKYLSKRNKMTLKDFFKTEFSFLIPIIIGILASSIIIFPTFATLLNNRADSNIHLTLKDILFPNMNTSYILYDSYGLGLGAIAIPAIIAFFKKKKENLFLGITLSLLVLFPICNYILNGTMYIDAKTLIPFLPLYILTIAEFLKNIFTKTINFKLFIPVLLIVSGFVMLNDYKVEWYLLEIGIILMSIILYNKLDKKLFIMIPVMASAFIMCLSVNKTDNLVLKYTANLNEAEIGGLIKDVTDNEEDIVRIANDFDISETVDKTYGNKRYYQSTIYSSISNQEYNRFYFDVMNNNIPSRNRALTVTTNNIMSLLFTNNKYLITRNKALQGYEQVSVNDSGIYTYKNENVLPLGFATSNVMSYEDFAKLNNPTKQEALLNVIVADVISNNNFGSSVKKENIDFREILEGDKVKVEDDESITIETAETLKYTYELPSTLQDKILFIRFKMNYVQSCSEGDLLIKINNVKNKLTCKTWKYYNGNEVFDFVLAEKDLKDLTISLTKGHYNLSDFEVYSLDYATIENVNTKVDTFHIDSEKTKGDIIYGNIEVTKTGYFMATIPYDKGFVIKVDDKEIKYEKVDEAFIGFKIEEGNHSIKIEYKAPLKDISLFLSGIGIITFFIVTFLENRRRIQ